MNICLVAQEFPPEFAVGGIGTQTFNKARTLAKLGHTVHVFCRGMQKDTECRTLSHDGVTVHRMRTPASETDGLYTQATYLVGYAWIVLKHLRRLMHDIRLDVVDFPEYGAEGFAFQLDRTAENWTPVVVQLHGPLSMFGERISWPPTDSDFFRVGTFMEDYSIKSADALMACSANIADFTAEYHGVAREHIDVVHCGVDAVSFHPPEEPRGQDHRPTLLYAGTITGAKGLEAVVEAVIRLRSKYPNILLQIAGSGDEMVLTDMRALARRGGAGSNLEYLGFLGRDEIAEAYRRADVFCSPAVHEPGVANVYIEAMASGCPVVACSTGGAPEAVIDGVTGILIPDQDFDVTAAAIDRILSNPAFRYELSTNARKRVDDYFAMDRYIERVLGTYHKAIESAQLKAAAVGLESLT